MLEGMADFNVGQCKKCVREWKGSVVPKHPSILNLFMKQIEMVCQQLAEDPLLQNGYHALGFSQVTKHIKFWPTKNKKCIIEQL